jgi:GTP-binding protein HflX
MVQNPVGGYLEKIITVGVQRSNHDEEATQASLDELERLVETAGGTVVETHVQKRDRPDPATFIGKGKVQELAERIKHHKAQALIFDDELKPGQQQNLEEAIGAKIIDRTRLILDIFAQRARTREGIFQVELAQMQYMLPRITAKFGTFEQQTGGIGTRGPGERKLEVDKRRVRERIVHLKAQIEKIKKERGLQREMREHTPVPIVALAGYTNAGKSSLLNALMQRDTTSGKPVERPVYADDKLFATLDPTTRRIRLPGSDKAGKHGRTVLFSDTVGFIRKLPTALIAAFRATLEEVSEADLLVHVVDASDPDWAAQEKAVLDILESLDQGGLSRITAFNKIDLLSPSQKAAFTAREGILISTRSGEGLEVLLKAVERRLAVGWVEKDLELSHQEGARLSEIYNSMEVLSKRDTARGISLRVRAHPSTLARFLKS